jgi:hypothetical protein
MNDVLLDVAIALITLATTLLLLTAAALITLVLSVAAAATLSALTFSVLIALTALAGCVISAFIISLHGSISFFESFSSSALFLFRPLTAA